MSVSSQPEMVMVKEGGKVIKGFTGGMTRQERRSFLHATFLHVIIRVRYFFSSWCFVKPLLFKSQGAYPSILRPTGAPEVDWLTAACIKALWFVGYVYKESPILAGILIKTRIMHLLTWFYNRLMENIARKMEESGVDVDKLHNIPIPEYDWKNGSPEEFHQTFVKRPHPVVLRGFLKGREIMNNTFANLVEKFGDEEVCMTKPGKKDGFMGKVKEVQNPQFYIHNCEILFGRHPEQWKVLETDRLEPYLRKKSSFAQYFIGKSGTGTPLHNAASWNFFHMVDGSKKWYFIDPCDFYLAYPWANFAMYNSSFLARHPDQHDGEYLPAFKWCPYYTTTLESGDVVLNPPWWGHSIRNVTEETVGVATRWHVEGGYGATFMDMEEDYDISYWHSFRKFLGLSTFQLLQARLYEPCPAFDEHSGLTRREIQASRIPDQLHQLQDSAYVVDGWKPLF